MKKVWSRLLSLLTALALCVALLPPAPAQAESLNLPTESEAIELLRLYRVIRGDANGNLWLEKNLTRAEAATIFVRAMGREEAATASHLAVAPFLDAMSHWGAPYIAEINRLGLMRGDPTGNFRPDANITYAEVLTVLFRMVEKELPNPWSPEAIFTAAQEIGLAPLGTEPTQPAARGKIFWSLASTISRIQVPSTGKTLMQMHLDTIPPDLTLDQTQITTRETSVTVSGTSFEAEKVLINGKPINRDKNGRFTLRQTYKIGTYALDVVAIDRVGNETAQQVVITVLPPISRIDVTAPSEFKVGSETKLTIKAFDTMGQEVTDRSELQATTTGDVASFDPATSTLYAGNIPGKGTLVLKWGRVTKSIPLTVSGPAAAGVKLAVNPNLLARPFATGKDVALQIQVQDANNKLVTTDNFRPISLRLEGLAGARLATANVETKSGTATVVLQAPIEGAATLTATSPGLPPLTIPISFMTSPRVVLSATPATLLPDGVAKTKITATLQDEAGHPITNTENDLVINLSATGVSSTLTGTSLTIKKGASKSNDTVELVAGLIPGEVIVSGAFSGIGYSIQPAKVSITGQLNARKLIVTAAPNTPLVPGTPATITLRVTDNANVTVPQGTYAFQFEVRTEQNDPLVNGLPEGVSLTFAGSTKTPVDDGRAPTDPLANPNSVVGRTVDGIATLTLTVPASKSGKITLIPKLMEATTAFNPTGGDAAALASTGLFAQPLELLFVNTAHHIELTATSQLGTNLPAAATTGASTVSVRARVVDVNGYTIQGNTDTITLSRLPGGNDIATVSSATSAKAVNGVAQFTITTKGPIGFDQFQATSGSLSSAPLTVATRNTRPLTPNVAKVAGATATTINTTGLVAPTDTHLALELFHQDPQLPGEPTNWVTVYVYRKGEGSTLVQGVPVDLAAANPVVRIPRSQLPVGTATYEFVLFNGAGYSDRSPDLGLSTATVKSFTDSYPIRAAYLDAVSGTLDLIDYNLPTTGIVDVSKIQLVKNSTVLQLDPAKVTVANLTSTGVTLNLGAQLADLRSDIWNGPIKVIGAGGWYDGQTAGWITNASETTLQPAPTITRAAYDPDQQALYLYGTNLNAGLFQLDKLAVNKPGNPAVALGPQDYVVQNTGSMVRVQLGTASQASLSVLGGDDLTLIGAPGWLVWNNGKAYGALGLSGVARPVYSYVQLTGWSYDRATKTVTITGRGLKGALLDPQKLRFEALGEVAVSWSPTATPTVTVASDTTVSFVLADADAGQFQTNFTGRQTYLNTLSGWLVDPLGRPADLVPDYSVLFGVPR